MTPCSVPGCTSRHNAKGFCHSHYSKWRRYGDPLAPSRRAASGSGHVTKYGYRVSGVGRGEAGDRMVHRLVAEAVLGHPLPASAVVHHVNGNRDDNRRSNLVICQDAAYHLLLHARMRARAATGDANQRLCAICKEYSPLSLLAVYRRPSADGKGPRFRHPGCKPPKRKTKPRATPAPFAELRQKGAVIMHVNGKSSDYSAGNIIICQDQVYHGLLLVRLRALRAVGNAAKRQCGFCGQYDDPAAMTKGFREDYWHKKCRNATIRARHAKGGNR